MAYIESGKENKEEPHSAEGDTQKDAQRTVVGSYGTKVKQIGELLVGLVPLRQIGHITSSASRFCGIVNTLAVAIHRTQSLGLEGGYVCLVWFNQTCCGDLSLSPCHTMKRACAFLAGAERRWYIVVSHTAFPAFDRSLCLSALTFE